MEQYFKVTRVLDQEKVTITSMYLSRDVKLWWRTCVEDDPYVGRWISSCLETLSGLQKTS